MAVGVRGFYGAADQDAGHVLTLPGLVTRACQAGHKVIFSNGHGAPMVTSTRYFCTSGVRAINLPPTLYSGPTPGGAMDEDDHWYFFTQLYSSQRGVASNLSMMGPWNYPNLDDANMGVRIPAGNYVYLRLNCAYDAAHLNWFQSKGVLVDRVRIWALPRSRGVCKLVDERPISEDLYRFDYTLGGGTGFDAIVAEDRIITAMGPWDRVVSVGNDPIPACKYQAFYMGRWWGLAQSDYPSLELMGQTKIKITPWRSIATADDPYSGTVPDYYMTARIISFSNPGGGNVDANSPNHGFLTGQSVTIFGTSSYNGTFTVTRINGNTFRFADVFTTPNQTGWGHLASVDRAADYQSRQRMPGKKRARFYMTPNLSEKGYVVGLPAGTLWQGENPRTYVGVGAGGDWVVYVINRVPVARVCHDGTVYLKGRAYASPGKAITAFANYGAKFPGTVLVTSASHGLTTGTSIIISGTANYDGTYTITVVTGNTFYITAVWVTSQTGTWHRTPPVLATRFSWTNAGKGGIRTAFGDTGEFGGTPLEGGMVIDTDGNLTFERKTTFDIGSYSVLQVTQYPFVPPILPVMACYPWAQMGTTVFLDRLSERGEVGPYHVHVGMVQPWGTVDTEFFARSIVENASWGQLMPSQPPMDTGMIGKALFVGHRFVSYIYDVTNQGLCWLTDDEGEGGLTSDLCNVDIRDYAVRGQPYLFYSRYGNPECGYYMPAMQGLGKGAFFWDEFEPGQGLTPVGLSVGPFGLEVLFREAEYLLRCSGYETPLLPGSYEIVRRPSRVASWAPRSIARDKDGGRLSVVSKPLGIARAVGESGNEILTDASQNRALLRWALDGASTVDAVGAYYSAEEGERYVIGNLNRSGETGGEHGAVLTFDSKGQLHVVRFDDMPISALMVLTDDEGKDRLIYGGPYGLLGTLFEERTDNRIPQIWRSWWYFSLADLQQISITGLRFFGQWPATGLPATWAMRVDIHAIAGTLAADSTLIPGLGTANRTIWFNSSNSGGSRAITPIDPLTSDAFVFALSGQHSVKLVQKGLEMMYVVPADVVTTRG